MISTRNSAGSYYKYMEGDIANIIAEMMRGGAAGIGAGQFEIADRSSLVRTLLTGKCAFRYGIEQHVNVEQEKILDSSSPAKSSDPPPPPRYRPLFMSTNTH